ncbi:ABC transporter substrate-binding protein [Streptomyces sp. A7024]|uniref:ABC transporter substrate-binding protein n=1 Tax=Streptomyces coryli TaxID=1128680 RepID=A0A6G4UD03_9ACTN|nr:ABC transporter substrate-binding protein [Streptomyces coryli]NGN69556.1 ABC transporter substrate-binding protein [Streptomyces coryli]
MRGHTRTPLLVIATAVVLTATAACGGGGSGSSGSSDSSGVVRASWGDPQNPLEPANTNEVFGGKVLRMITRGLKSLDPKSGQAEDDLAESVESDDQKSWTVKIKKGQKFSNGEAVTAKSFVDAWNYAANVKNKQVNAPFFSYIKGYDDVHPADAKAQPEVKTMSGLKVVDDQTFQVELTQPFAVWPETLAYPAMAPLPKAFFDDHDAWLDKPIGNGPYKIDSYSKGKSMKLVKDDKYTGSDKAKNEGVELKVYTDPNTAYTDLQAGNLDLMDDLPANQLANAESDLGDRYINQPAGIIQTITFPLYDKEWQGANAAKVRRGISMAINRDQITKSVFENTRIPAKDWTSPVIGEKGGYDKNLCGADCKYDPKKAKQLIEEGGGIPGGKLTLTSNVDTGSHKDWMDAVCNSLNKAIGKENVCTVNPVGTFGDFRSQVTDKKMKGPFRTGWQMDYPNIETFLSKLYYTGASANDGGYSNKNFDKLIDDANAAKSTEDAVATYKDAEKLLVKDIPAIPLWYQNGTAGYSDGVSDVKLYPDSIPVYQDVKVNG